MKYFVQVTAYSNTTTLGKALAVYAHHMYDQALLTKEQFEEIPGKLLAHMEEIIKERPRVKPMKIYTSGFLKSKDPWKLANGYPSPRIFFASVVNGHDDNRPFTLSGTLVRLDYTEEGGES